MANLNSKNYQAQYIDKPSQKIRQGEVSGIKRIIHDSYEIPAGGIAAADVIRSLILP